MNISMILAHPEQHSFNHALAQELVAALTKGGHRVRLHDLYQERFDPLLKSMEARREAKLPAVLRRHCLEIAQAEGLVIIHPNWWGQPPAILKGWVDRVLRPGVAYEFVEGDGGEGVPRGLLRAHTAVVFNTSNTPIHRERSAFGDPLQRIWKDCIFDLCGVKQFRRRMFGVIVTSTPQQRAAWLRQARQLALKAFSPARKNSKGPG